MDTFTTVKMIQALLEHLGQELQDEMDSLAYMSPDENYTIYQKAIDECWNVNNSFDNMYMALDDMERELV